MKKILTLLAIALAALTSCRPDGGEISPSEVYLNVYYDDIVFPSDGGGDSFEIESNGDWVITNDADWLTIEPSEGKGSCSIALTASASDLYDDRNTVITVSAGDKTETFTVTQKYAEALLVTKNKFDIPQEGGEFTVEVQSNITYDIVIDEGCQSWITEVPSSKALNTYTHTFSVESNQDTTKRDGSIEIIGSNGKTETVNIYQAQKGELVLSKSVEIVPAKGGEVRVQLRSNVDYEVIVPEDVDWVEQLQSDKADELVFNVKPNSSDRNREAKITIKDKNSDLSQIFRIIQTSGGIVLDETYYEVPASGDTLDIVFTSYVEYEIIIGEDDASWITYEETESEVSYQHNLRIFIGPNTVNEIRTAEIDIKDKNSDLSQTITIKQIVGSIILEDSYFEVGGKGGIVEIKLSTDIDVEVVIPDDIDWITIMETKALVEMTLQLNVQSNSNKEERTALIAIKDINSPVAQSVEIKQMPDGYYIGDISAETEEELIEIRDAGYKVIDGNVYLNVKTLSQLDNLIEEITGDLTIGGDVTSLDGLYGLKLVGKDLKYKQEYNSPLEMSFEGLNNLESIGGNFNVSLYSNNFDIYRNISLKSLKKLKSIGGNFTLSNIENFEGPENLSEIGDSLILTRIMSCTGLTGIRSLKSLKAYRLYSFDGLNNLTTISGDFCCENGHLEDNFNGLNNLQMIGGDFTLKVSSHPGAFNAVTSFEGLNNLKEIGGNFLIDVNTYASAFESLENFKGLENLNTINGGFIINISHKDINSSSWSYILNRLTSFEGFSSLKNIAGCFKIKASAGSCDVLCNLQSLSGFNSLSEVNGDFIIDLHSGWLYPTICTSLDFSEGPQNLSLINGDFIITEGVSGIGNDGGGYSSISSMSGFSGLKTVNGDMKIRYVDSYSGLDNLEYIAGDFEITSGDTQGMSNLKAIGGNLIASDKDTPGYNQKSTTSINGLTGLTTISGNLTIEGTDMQSINGIEQLKTVGGDIEISSNDLLVDISGFSGLTNCANISITNSPNLYNFQPLETAAKNMTGTWYVYGCGYNPTKYQMLNGESKPQE